MPAASYGVQHDRERNCRVGEPIRNLPGAKVGDARSEGENGRQYPDGLIQWNAEILQGCAPALADSVDAPERISSSCHCRSRRMFLGHCSTQ